MIRQWIRTLSGGALQVEGATGFFQKLREQGSLRKTLNVVKSQGYRLQFLDQYVEDHPEALLSPLIHPPQRFSACAIQKVFGYDEGQFRRAWNGVENYEIRGDLGAALSNASFWGFPFFVLTEDQVLLRDCSWDIKSFRKIIDRPAVTKEIPGRAIILPLHRSRNYYHWVIEVLPRVQFLMEQEIWNRVPVIVPPLQGFQMESLTALGLNQEWLIPFNPEKDHFKIEEAIYPSRFGANRKVSRSSVDWIRAAFASKELKRDRKIYYSRSSAKSRRIPNESEFLPELVKRGFEVFSGEELSFKEQVSLFAQAKVVIGAHGAGLTNIVFCASGVPVLELMGSDYINPCFGELCESGGNPYSVFVGKPEDEGDYRIDSKLFLREVDHFCL